MQSDGSLFQTRTAWPASQAFQKTTSRPFGKNAYLPFEHVTSHLKVVNKIKQSYEAPQAFETSDTAPHFAPAPRGKP